MKICVGVMVMLLSIPVFSQTNDLPSNPESGKCYVRCFTKEKEKTKWDQIDCTLINYQKLEVTIENPALAISKKDSRVIDRKLVPYIKKGYRLQIRSHYVSSEPDSVNVKISSQRAIAIGNYLVEKGMNPDLLIVTSLGNLETNKIEIEYRVVNVNAKQ